MECEGGELLGLVGRRGADGVFDGGDGPWSHAQLANAEANEEGGCGGIGCQLAAYRNPGPRGCRVGDFGDEVQHRGVERIGARGNVRVAALGGKCVLG